MGRKVWGKVRYGYSRIWTDDQNLDRQRVALAREDWADVIEETGSGVKARHRLDALLGRLQPGDELVVSELDRLGRSTGEVVLMLDELTRRGVALRILATPSLDITHEGGRLIADITAALATHERQRSRRRQEQGIAAAKAAGRQAKMNGQQINEARAGLADGEAVSTLADADHIDLVMVCQALGHGLSYTHHANKKRSGYITSQQARAVLRQRGSREPNDPAITPSDFSQPHPCSRTAAPSTGRSTRRTSTQANVRSGG